MPAPMAVARPTARGLEKVSRIPWRVCRRQSAPVAPAAALAVTPPLAE